MQPRPSRSPWFQMTKALLSTSTPLRDAHAARPITGWRQFGVEVGGQIRRYLEEFYEAAAHETHDELAPLIEEFRRLATRESAPLLAWVTQHLPEVLEGAEPKERKEFATGLREGAAG
jgi:hypothetical protein